MTRPILVASGLVALAWAFAPAAGAADAPPEGPKAPAPATVPAPPPPTAPAPTPAPAKPPAAPKPPAYGNPRHVEDWSALRCVPLCDRCDVTDRLKAIPPGSWFQVDVGGQVRFRYERWQGQGFGGISDADDDWTLARFRLHANLRFGDHFRVFAEGIYADQWEERDAGPRPTDVNEGDVINLFAEGYGAVGCDLRLGGWVGRHELNFGKQRVIGPLDWGNTRRTFDGGGAWLTGQGWRLDAFAVEPVLVEATEWDEGDEDTLLAGLYYANSRSKTLAFDAYLLYFRRDDATWLGSTDDEERFTLGVRANGAIASTRFDWDAEAAWQVGTFGDRDVSAGFVSGEVGWKPPVPCSIEPRLALGGDWASGDGDGDAGSGDLGTYNQLFPTGHLWFGWCDLIGRQNLAAARLTASVKPTPKWLVRADYHAFWRSEEDDAVYNAAGGVLRADSGSNERFVGTELDLMVRWTIDRHWELEAGWGHFFPGDFVEATGADDDVDFVYGSVTFTF
jgi:hypothetical protein